MPLKLLVKALLAEDLFQRYCLITVRNEVAKVMFLQACVCPHEGRGVSVSVYAGIPPPPLGTDTPLWSRHPPEQTPPSRADPPGSRHPPEQTPPSPARDGHCCGQYTSYWNAFLFSVVFYIQIQMPVFEWLGSLCIN